MPLIDADFSGSWREQTADNFQSRSLAGAVWSDQAKNFATCNCQRELIGGNELSGLTGRQIVFLGDPFDLDHGWKAILHRVWVQVNVLLTKNPALFCSFQFSARVGYCQAS